MPATRLVGNLMLSWLTRLATGLPHVFDSQCGYTAVGSRGLSLILEGEMFPRYGYPNHLLLRLARQGVRVLDVPVRPVYGPSWRSGIRIRKVVGPLLRLLVPAATRQLLRKVGSRSKAQSTVVGASAAAGAATGRSTAAARLGSA